MKKQTLADAPPRLVVVLVVDQFRSDYLDYYRSEFGDAGLMRLMREGAVFRECFYPYAITETGPGHATLATGTTPDRHGIGANQWFNPELGKDMYAMFDENSPVVGGTPGQTPVSPRNLNGTTLSDEMRLATGGKSLVFGVALKDRASILSTGHGANAAYWYDSSGTGFVTSTYYRGLLPEWVLAFNKTHAVQLSTEPTARRRELGTFRESAAANRLVSEFAMGLVDNERLGRDETTDFLFIGFSANDYTGHRYGPYSEEVRKITHETDVAVADLLRQLDAKVGRGKYWFVFSADHGVAPSLAEARDASLAHLDAKNIDVKAVRAAMEAKLSERWGSAHWLLPVEGLYLDRKVLTEKNARLEEAVRIAGEAAEKMPGVWGYVSRFGSRMPESIINSYQRSNPPGRGPDLEIVPLPFALPDMDKGGTTHGTPFTYDTQVPLILVGAPFVPGEYYQRCSPADMAMTLSAMLHIHSPSLANGRVLAESFPARSAAASAATREAQP
ncbi:MAG TPA: alkaline phosphatase family protein [Candidatus Acidoferrales bacterium]|nr:alkaline phosphatase family protein [Candidatus Acidoferrales bacterium]